MLEHWQHIALGALCTTPIIGALWSTARGWRLKAMAAKHEIDRLNRDKAEAAKTGADLAKWGIGLAGKLADEQNCTADLSSRLNRIIALETPRGSHASKKMAKIAKGII